MRGAPKPLVTSLAFSPQSSLGWNDSPSPTKAGHGSTSPLFPEIGSNSGSRRRSPSPAIMTDAEHEEEWRKRRAKDWQAETLGGRGRQRRSGKGSPEGGRRSRSRPRRPAHRTPKRKPIPIAVGERPSSYSPPETRRSFMAKLPERPGSARGRAAQAGWTLQISSMHTPAMSFAATPSASQMQRVRAVPRVADVIGAMLRDEAAGVFSVSTERAVATVCGRQSTAAELRRECRVAAHELEAAREQAAELHAEMAATTHRAATNFGTAATLRPRRSSSITGAMGAAQLARELRSGSTSRRAAGGDDDASSPSLAVEETRTREERELQIRYAVADPVSTGRALAAMRGQVTARVAELEALRLELQVLVDSDEGSRVKRKQKALHKARQEDERLQELQLSKRRKQVYETVESRAEKLEKKLSLDLNALPLVPSAPGTSPKFNRVQSRTVGNRRRRASVRLRTPAQPGRPAKLKNIAEELNLQSRLGEVQQVVELFGHGATCVGTQEYCADINWRDSRGRTPLIYATVGGHYQIATLLVRKGAEVNIADRFQHTALHYAYIGQTKSADHDAILKLLVANAADNTIPNNAMVRPRSLRARGVDIVRHDPHAVSTWNSKKMMEDSQPETEVQKKKNSVASGTEARTRPKRRTTAQLLRGKLGGAMGSSGGWGGAGVKVVAKKKVIPEKKKFNSLVRKTNRTRRQSYVVLANKALTLGTPTSEVTDTVGVRRDLQLLVDREAAHKLKVAEAHKARRDEDDAARQHDLVKQAALRAENKQRKKGSARKKGGVRRAASTIDTMEVSLSIRMQVGSGANSSGKMDAVNLSGKLLKIGDTATLSVSVEQPPTRGFVERKESFVAAPKSRHALAQKSTSRVGTRESKGSAGIAAFAHSEHEKLLEQRVHLEDRLSPFSDGTHTPVDGEGSGGGTPLGITPSQEEVNKWKEERQQQWEEPLSSDR